MPYTRFALAVLAAAPLFAQTTRPISHADYDAWRSITPPKLSPDGRWVVYGIFPQVGDGQVIVKELATGKEIRENAGQRPAPPEPDPLSEGPPPVRGITAEFSSDSRFAVFTVFPSKSDLDKARREKKRPADMPKNAALVVDLAAARATRIDNVKSFQVPDNATNYLAYLKESNELVIRSFADGRERAYKDAAEYLLTNDGETLVWLDKKGAYAAPNATGEPAALASGEAKYARLAADEKHANFAFLKGKQLYHWDRKAPAAAMLADNAASAPLAFSGDGARLFFATAPDRVEPKRADPAEDAVYDLWHYRDDYIQPMQKVRARQERERAYRAVVHLADKKVVQLADAALPEVQPAREGISTVGMDDRAYRRVREFDERYADVYSVDTLTGRRQLLARKVGGQQSVSPNGKFVLTYEDRHWISYDLATGERRNLTAIAGRAFHKEDDDHPGAPPTAGPPFWTKDGAFVLLPDRYDIWQAAPDGSLLRNLTDGLGRREKTVFRVIRMSGESSDRGGDRTIDPAQPVILKAVNETSFDAGFWRDSLDPEKKPEKLFSGPYDLGNPVKAKNSDVVLMTAARFDRYPDLQVTNSSFSSPRAITSEGEQTKAFAWGTAEVISYRNGDGKLLKAGLYKPANFDPAKKYPMIVYIYEKLAQNVNAFVDPAPSHRINASYYTSNGYVVLMPDIVYQVGYPGESALRCVIPATQTVVDMGFVDPERVGIQGHSWGGYQIAYMVTQTDRFKAAAPGALVANMISAYDGIRWGPGLPRQFQYERTQSRIGGTLWQYPMRFIENSPIFMADRVRTPILMLHNDADDAVPWYQGIEFFLALRRLDKEAYFFNYNGEPHGLRKRPNQKDYTVRMQEFFDHYLKGAPKPAWMERGRPYIDKEPAPAASAPSDDVRP
ncbi:MAG: prolyl oligopeptidase family serine peptidase [Bryobacteraceae bacterium]|nr:prolyl oligopeptidase family serine peptidase [Bryobacteraceae bacterium]